MRKFQLIVILTILTALFNRLAAQDSTQDYKFAAGIRLSTPSPTISNSVSIKYFLNDRAAIEGLISFGNKFGIGGLFEMHQLIGGIQSLNWFYGGGAYIGFSDGKVFTGPTGIIGMDYKFDHAPINLSLDWKPELDISPEINFIPDALAFTVRFTLK
ncbi:MAG TPA: hypothetical protein VMI12_11805 [Puia sp.]|nr:hypothetical protein [Puia sp.]